MRKRELNRMMRGRAIIVGCQLCGTYDQPLRAYQEMKVCPACYREFVSKEDTGKEAKA